MAGKLLHTPEGVRDIYNEECEIKMYLQDLLHDTINKYGYHSIETPTFEYFDIFSREIGTTPSKDLYKFFDKEGETLCLRPDITPSIARCVAKYFREEENEIRLSYMGNTFINHADYRGRLKETTQIGAELIGNDSVMADGEIIAMVIDCMLKSGLTDFQVSIGQVDFFKSLLAEAGIDEESEGELRELISNKNYFGIDEFANMKNLSKELDNAFQRLPELFGSIDILYEAKKLTTNKDALAAIDRLLEVYNVVSYYNLEKYISFDLGMLSKYKYYTGIIIKAFTYGTGEPLVTGGRYDNLLMSFGKNSPSIGFVINIENLMLALRRQKINTCVIKNNVLVLYDEDCVKEGIKVSSHLRNNSGLDVALNANNKSPKDYIEYAKCNHINKIYTCKKDSVQIFYISKNDVKEENLSYEVVLK